MPIRVLIVDDDPTFIARFRETYQADFELHSLPSADPLLQECLAPAFRWKIDVLLLDLHLPGTDGISAFSKISECAGELPAAFLLTQDERPSVRMLALECGFHDILNKSMAVREIFLRIRNSLALRLRPATAPSKGVKLDPGNLELVRDAANRVQLTPKEFRILTALQDGSARPVSKESLMGQAWRGTRVSPQTLNSHVFNLNQKLAPLGLRVIVDRSGVYCDGI